MADGETFLGYPVSEGFIDVPQGDIPEFRRQLAAQRDYLSTLGAQRQFEDVTRQQERAADPWSYFLPSFAKGLEPAITSAFEPFTQPEKWEARKARSEISVFLPQLQELELKEDWDAMGNYLQGIYARNPRLTESTGKFLQSYLDKLGKIKGAEKLEGVFAGEPKSTEVMGKLLTNPSFRRMEPGVQTSIIGFVGKMKDKDLEDIKGWTKVTDARTGEIYRVNIRTGDIERMKGPREEAEAPELKGLTGNERLAMMAAQGATPQQRAREALRLLQEGKSPSEWSSILNLAGGDVEKALQIKQQYTPNAINSLIEIRGKILDPNTPPAERARLQAQAEAVIQDQERVAKVQAGARAEETRQSELKKDVTLSPYAGRIFTKEGQLITSGNVGEAIRRGALTFRTPGEVQGFTATIDLKDDFDRLESAGKKVLRAGGPGTVSQLLASGVNWATIQASPDPDVQTFAGLMDQLTQKIAVSEQGARPSDADIRLNRSLIGRQFTTLESFLARLNAAREVRKRQLNRYQGSAVKISETGEVETSRGGGVLSPEQRQRLEELRKKYPSGR